MKRNRFIGVSLLLAGLSVAGLAVADRQTNFFAISTLTATNAGYRVVPTGSIVNPKSCASSDFYEPLGSITTEQREVLDKTLLSAFLAGRKVDLNLSTLSCGPNNRPAYFQVKLDQAN